MTERRKYERHGLARGETLATFKACQDINRNEWTRVCPEWRASDAVFTRAVIAEVGLRPEADQFGRCLLVPTPAWENLIEPGQSTFDREEWFYSEHSRMTLRRERAIPEEVWAGWVFQPGHVRWRWQSFNRKPKVKSTKPLPEKFVRSDWSAGDQARHRAAQRRRKKALRERPPL
jgi:hypothetical protein